MKGKALDRPSYLRPAAQKPKDVAPCDIFFPTNFGWLARLYRAAQAPLQGQTDSHTMKSAVFAKAFADVHAAECVEGA